MLLTITFDFDFSLDANDFFTETEPERRAALVAAGEIITASLGDTLTAIVPGSISPGDTWTATYRDPSTGDPVSTDNLSIDENVIRVFAGGRDLGATLGVGGPGGFGVSGATQAWIDTVAGRGQAGALLADDEESDFGPWGGAITFNTTTNWHFGTDVAGLDNGESDFLSVAIHELYHLIGFGTADSWQNLVVGSSFTGTAATAEFDQPGGPPVQIVDGQVGGHWEDGTTDNGAEAAMDPVIFVGTRKLPTPLDVAGLDDLGWEIAQAAPSVQVDLRILRTSSATDANGEVPSIPDDVDFLDEWDEFLVEVWASTPADDTSSVSSFTVDIPFDELLFEATTIEHGGAFTDTRQGTIDNSSGLIQGVSASTSQTSIALNDFALLARVFFQVRAEADLPNDDLSGEYILPTIDDEFLIQNVAISMSGGVSADVNTQTATSIEVWPVMFDLDDDGTIGFGDVADLAAVFGTTLENNNGAYRADFNRTGVVEFADIILFAENFGSTRDSLIPQTYDGNFPADWRPVPPLSLQQSGSSAEATAAVKSDLSVSVPDPTTDLAPAETQHQHRIEVQTVVRPQLSIEASIPNDSPAREPAPDNDLVEHTAASGMSPDDFDRLWMDGVFGLFRPLDVARII